MWILLLKWIKTILNSKLFLYAVIGGIIYLSLLRINKLTETVSRLENNQHAILVNSTEQVSLTTREFKNLYHKEDSIAQLVGIKSKQLQNVIVNNYHYKDSTIITIPLKPDSINHSDTLKFIVPLGCITLKGYVVKDNITFSSKEYKDKLHTFLYGVRPHKFLFIKYGKWIIEAKTYSECLQKNINIEKNLRINE